ncbi:putative dehydrogenase [Paenibacillus sp. NAIST15-1]|nr:putative dehydrogenase [Paenibacillus sp. NAIST15-1]
MKPLQDQVAVVAGATRGAGRGIAAMLELFGVTKENWKDAVKQDPHFIMGKHRCMSEEQLRRLRQIRTKWKRQGNPLARGGCLTSMIS